MSESDPPTALMAEKVHRAWQPENAKATVATGPNLSP